MLVYKKRSVQNYIIYKSIFQQPFPEQQNALCTNATQTYVSIMALLPAVVAINQD